MRRLPTTIAVSCALLVTVLTPGAALASGSVTSSDIKNDTIRGKDIHSSTITASDLHSGSVGSSEISSSAVGSSEIATSAVGASEIASDAVGSSEIAAGAVGTGELADAAVTAAKIAADAVTAAAIGTGAVGSDEIADGSIASADLGEGSVDANALDSDAVSSGKVVDGSLEPADMAVVPSARVRLTSEQTMHSDEVTAISWDVSDWDQNGVWSPDAPTRLTAPVNGAGLYTVSLNAMWDPSTVGWRYLVIRRTHDGATEDLLSTGLRANSFQGPMNLSTTTELDAGDYLEAYVLQDSGSDLQIQDDDLSHDGFTMTWIAPTPDA